MEVFIFFVWLVACMLGIILFFKIWGMTNDIRAIKREYLKDNEVVSKEQMLRNVRENIVLGNTDKVKRIILQKFIDDVEYAYSILPVGDYVEDENGVSKWTSFKEKNLNASIVTYIDNLTRQFEKIGEEVPIYIKRMQTFRDYFDIFTEDDLRNMAEKDGERVSSSSIPLSH